MSSEYSSLTNYNKHLPGTVGGAKPIFGTTTRYLQVVPEYKLQLGYDALTHGASPPDGAYYMFNRAYMGPCDGFSINNCQPLPMPPPMPPQPMPAPGPSAEPSAEPSAQLSEKLASKRMRKDKKNILRVAALN